MRNILLTYVTGEETGLEKSGNLEKSGKVFNDTESVSARTEIQNLPLTPKPLQLMTEEKLNRKAESSSFCTDFSPLPLAQLPLPQIYSSTSLFCDPGGRPMDCITWTHLPTGYWSDLANGRHWEETGGRWGSEIRLFILHSLPALVMSLIVVMSLHDYSSCQAGPYLQAPALTRFQ